MAENVKITLEAIDKASAEINKTLRSLLSLGGVLNVVNSVKMAFQGFEAAINNTAGASVNYANDVRRLQAASGQTAEETSRMIQVFDDFKITVDQLTPAIKAMTNQGLTPNLETIAQLSDAYLALQTPLERNEFLMKNFGRAGLDLAEIMGKGSEAIREMSDAVDENLIMTQEAVDAAREYELAVDDLSDAWMGLKVQIGNAIIPALTDLMTVTTELQGLTARQKQSVSQMTAGYSAGLLSMRQYGESLERIGLSSGQVNFLLEQTREIQKGMAWTEWAQGVYDAQQAVESATPALQTFADVLENMGMSNEQFLGNVQSMQGAVDNFEDAVDEFNSAKAILDEQLASGEIGADEYAAEMDKITAALDKARAASELWVKQFILQLVTTQLSEGGLTAEELDQVLAVGEALGLIDPEVAETTRQVIAAINSADATALEEALRLMEELFSYDGQTVTVTTNVVETTTAATTTQAPTIQGGTSAGGGITFNNAQINVSGEFNQQSLLEALL